MSETSTHGSKRKALEQHDEEVFTPQVSNMRPKMSPLGLAAAQTGWQPYGATPIADFAYWEKNLIQVERRKDLKVIFKEDEDVPWDEGDSSDFESLSGEMGF
jgi:hypothetical protein